MTIVFENRRDNNAHTTCQYIESNIESELCFYIDSDMTPTHGFVYLVLGDINLISNILVFQRIIDKLETRLYREIQLILIEQIFAPISGQNLSDIARIRIKLVEYIAIVVSFAPLQSLPNPVYFLNNRNDAPHYAPVYKSTAGYRGYFPAE